MRKQHHLLDEGMIEGKSSLGWVEEEMLWVGKSCGFWDLDLNFVDGVDYFFQLIGRRRHYAVCLVLSPIILGFIAVLSWADLWGNLLYLLPILLYLLYFFRGNFKARVVEYGISETDVFFKKRSIIGRTWINVLSLVDIDKVYVEQNQNGTANVHLITQTRAGFRTYHLDDSEARPFPTMEHIKEYEKVLDLIKNKG